MTLNPVLADNQQQRLTMVLINRIAELERQVATLSAAVGAEYTENATVTDYTSGPTCTIGYDDGATRVVGYLTGYTPTVGDQVCVFNLPGRVFVLKPSQ